MLSQNIKVSIIIPVYNNVNTVTQTINSVQSQSYTNWEIICVDDGSTDGTDSKVIEISKYDNRVIYVKRDKPNKGGSVCRNIGINKSTGDYILFLDGDDLLADYCIEKRLIAIQSSDYDFVVFPYGSFSSDVTKCQINRVYHKAPEYLFASSISAWIITSSLFKRSFLLELGGFDESFPRFQDIELHLRALTYKDVKYSVFGREDADCYYRLSSSGYSAEKLQRTLTEAYPKLVGLLSQLINRNQLCDRNRLSFSLIALHANMSIIKHKLWKNGGACPTITEWEEGIIKGNTRWFCPPSISLLTKDYSSVLFPSIYFRIVWLFYKYSLRYLRK